MAEASLLAMVVGSLLVGPLLSWAWPAGRAWRAFLDGLSLALVGGLCLLHLAPHALAEGGLAALAAGTVGFLGPALAHRSPGPGRGAWLLLGAVAVLFHSAIDGAVLGVSGSALALAVAGHQVPVGMGIWALAGRVRIGGLSAPMAGWLAIGAVVLATLGGYFAGSAVIRWMPELLASALEAAVAGALLHVVFDVAGDHAHAVLPPRVSGAGLRLAAAGQSSHPFVRSAAPIPADHGHEACRDHHHGHGSAATRAWSSVGALLGCGAIALVSRGGDHAVAHLSATLHTFVSLGLDGAPALLLGYVIAGVSAAMLPEAPARWSSGGGRVGEALKGVAFGLPLPVCSCGVLPLYESLVRRGVPATAAIAFLVATPELGPDAVLLSVPLLGAPFAGVRVASAALLSLAVAWLVGHTAPRTSRPVGVAPPPPRRAWSERLRTGARFAGIELVDHTLPWVALGLLAAALAEPLLDHDLLGRLPPVVQVPVFAAVSIPLYVCASGATPLAAVAVHKGASAGAALAFLLAGPATNLTTFAVLGRLHGRTVALRFAAAVLGVAVILGWATDLLSVPVNDVSHSAPEVHERPFAAVAGATLVALGLASLFRQGARGVLEQILAPTHTPRVTGR